mmetsp:Transcript_10472/g.36132  ORF Transcript_10472/g.36132 Transcript_10472/m.36132 type:complete len:753 (+) Transcript_10472:1841-4099(+)
MVQDINTALSHCGIATHARRHRERGASRGGKEFFAVVHIVELLPLEHELKLLVAFLDLKFHRKLIRNDLDEVAHPERVVVVVMVLVVHQEFGPRLDPEDVRELVQGAVRGDLPDVDVPIGADEGVDRVVLQVRGRRGLVLREGHEDVLGVVRRPARPELAVLELHLPGHQPPVPRDLLLSALVLPRPLLGGGLLVLPVGRQPILVDKVHVRSPDLNLKWSAVLAHHHSVQRLVPVLLGVLDVVLELALHRGPDRVHQVQHGVALGLLGDDAPASAQVVDLLERDLLLLHLLVDSVNVLGPAVQILVLQAALLHGLLELVQVLLQVVPLPRHEVVLEAVLQLQELSMVQVPEAQVLQLGLDGPHPEPVRQRHEDVHGLLRDPLLLLGRERVQGPHVVQPIRELDQHHPHVRHAEEHVLEPVRVVLARGPRGGDGLGAHGVPVDLRHVRHAAHADHHVHDLLRNVLAQLLLGHHRVVQDVMQEACRHGLLVQSELGQDLRRLHHVAQVRLAVPAELAGVRAPAELKRELHEGGAKDLVPVAELLRDAGLLCHGDLLVPRRESRAKHRVVHHPDVRLRVRLRLEGHGEQRRLAGFGAQARGVCVCVGGGKDGRVVEGHVVAAAGGVRKGLRAQRLGELVRRGKPAHHLLLLLVRLIRTGHGPHGRHETAQLSRVRQRTHAALLVPLPDAPGGLRGSSAVRTTVRKPLFSLLLLGLSRNVHRQALRDRARLHAVRLRARRRCDCAPRHGGPAVLPL